MNAIHQIFQYNLPFELECGQVLPQIEVAYHTFGKLNAQKNNVIWVCHALTANSDVSDWWNGLFGSGNVLNPDEYFIVCANMLGSCYGSTNALSIDPTTRQPYFHTFPLITVRDMVKSLDLLRVHLGIEHIAMCIGGSMGGQQALEWAIEKPQVFEQLVLLATNAFHSPWGIAFNESQRLAIQADATWKENHEKAGLAGLKAARAIALLSYRNYETYQTTQSDNNDNQLENAKATTYQQYQGEKLVKRFHAFSYWTLSKAMDSHNVGRNRGNVEKALQQVKAETLVIGIGSDVLFPPAEQKFLAQHIPQAQYLEIDSLYGHDGFLIENRKIRDAIFRMVLTVNSIQ